MSYSRDPMWIKARFGSVCGCGARVGKGQQVFYYPLQKRALCVKCSWSATARRLDSTATARKVGRVCKWIRRILVSIANQGSQK